MTKEKEIYKMLKYMAENNENYFNPVKIKSDGVFVVNRYFHINNIEFSRRDRHYFIVDFNLQTVEAHAYDESHHNGDSYNEMSVAVDWKLLLTTYDSIKRDTTALALINFKEEELKQAALKEKKFAEDLLENILSSM